MEIEQPSSRKGGGKGKGCSFSPYSVLRPVSFAPAWRPSSLVCVTIEEVTMTMTSEGVVGGASASLNCLVDLKLVLGANWCAVALQV